MDSNAETPPAPERTPAQRRALAALGIEDWVRRDAAPPVEGAVMAVETASIAVERAAPAAPAVEAPAPPSVAPTDRLADARAALDAPSAASAAPAVHAAPEAGAADVGAEPAVAEAAPTEAPGPERPVEADEAPPHFELQALSGGGGLLLVDGTLALDRSELRRLADLLRAALAVRSPGADAVSIRPGRFSWPQLDLSRVDSARVDQGPARAREAVAAWVLRSTEDGDGVVIVVEAPTPDADVLAAYAALEALPVRRIRLPSTVLTEPGANSARDAWARFAALGPSADTRAAP